jgi:hypothetical protein
MNDDSDEDIPPTVQVIRQGDASDSMPASGDHPGPSRGRFQRGLQGSTGGIECCH